MKKNRLLILYVVFLTAAAMITMRFYRIAEHRSKAETVLSGQYTRRMEIVSRKGLIFDRNGTLISEKPCGYRTIVNPIEKTNEEIYETAKTLHDAGGEEMSYYIEKMYRGAPFYADTTRLVSSKYGTCFPVYEARNDDFLCHVLGYRNCDGKGMSGIMKAYDEYLSHYTASTAFIRYEADATGAVMTDGMFLLREDDYNEKEGLALTIDETMQKAVESVCNDTMDRGAVVVEDVKTGEITAICSRPSYTPSTVPDYLDSEKGELTNRALSAFTPGSVFKTVLAAAALERDSNAAERTYCCNGAITIYDTTVRCHKRDGHGTMTMKEAFAQSCNPYFIDLGMSLGKDAIEKTAQKLGLFCYDDVSLLPCDKGTFPNRKEILPAALANLSVGQGDILLSPVGVCGMMATAATGIRYKPSLVKSFMNEKTVTEQAKEGQRVLSEKTVATLKEMLRSCVEDGTGYRAAGEIPCGGKTATAQSGQKKEGKEVIHSWFAGFYPVDEPRFAICVFCDGNGENTVHPSLIFKIITEKIEAIDSGKITP